MMKTYKKVIVFSLLAFVIVLWTYSCRQHQKRHMIIQPLQISKKGFVSFKNVADGNYRVHVKVGSDKSEGHTVIRGESRRMFFDGIKTEKGELKDVYFNINKRDTIIEPGQMVRIKSREKDKLNWDADLTFEFNGASPQVKSIEITPIDSVITVFLCGNSTVVDQDNEPWCGWGQILPRFFNERICVANYAESGETATSFMVRRRLDKILTQIKAGDYLFVEFGHNDQKEKGEGKGAYLNFTDRLLEYVAKARAKGAYPVFVTPTQRRSFNEDGKIVDTHGAYPDAMRKVARENKVPLIDLHAYTRNLYEAMGVSGSINAFVHYPANTFPNQSKALKDNTHFNPYGGYQIAKCVIYGMKEIDLPIVEYLRKDVADFNPFSPDEFNKFKWYPTPSVELEKPEGN